MSMKAGWQPPYAAQQGQRLQLACCCDAAGCVAVMAARCVHTSATHGRCQVRQGSHTSRQQRAAGAQRSARGPQPAKHSRAGESVSDCRNHPACAAGTPCSLIMRPGCTTCWWRCPRSSAHSKCRPTRLRGRRVSLLQARLPGRAVAMAPPHPAAHHSCAPQLPKNPGTVSGRSAPLPALPSPPAPQDAPSAPQSAPFVCRFTSHCLERACGAGARQPTKSARY